MKQAAYTAPFTTMRLVGYGVWLELLRRQDLYVCGLLMLVFLLGVVVMRIVGIDAPATGTFMLNMGLRLSAIAAHVLTLLLAVRQFPSEIENRTLYPLLARPVRRADLVLAKWLAVGVSGIVVYVVLTVLTWSSVPKLESYAAGLLLQMVLLQWISLLLVAGVAVVLSLLVPRGIALLVGGGLFFAGPAIRRLLAEGSGVRRVLAAYVPDFGLLDLVTRYTDGIGPLSGSEMLTLCGYGGGLVLLSVALAVLLFAGRRI